MDGKQNRQSAVRGDYRASRRQSAPPHRRRLSKAQKRRILRRRRMRMGVLTFCFILFLSLVGRWRSPVTARDLRQFGWQGQTSHAEIVQLNRLLRKYRITSKPSLTMFFATAASESGCGRLVLEEGGADYYAAHGYSTTDRGAGYLQMTHRAEQLAFLQAMRDDFNGTDTASYIAEKYPWESACWEWSVGKTSPEPNPNTYAKKRGNRPEVFLVTQYAINGWTIRNDMLRAIVQGAEYSVQGDMIQVQGEVAPTPKNWQDRLQYYEKAKEIWG